MLIWITYVIFDKHLIVEIHNLRAKASIIPPGVSPAIADPPKVSHVSRLGGASDLLCPRTNTPELRSWFSGCHCWWILEVRALVDRLVISSSWSSLHLTTLQDGALFARTNQYKQKI